MSSDATPDLLRALSNEYPDRLDVVADRDPAHRQGAKMTALAQRARDSLGDGWVIPFDADEIWYSPFGRIADVLADVPERHHVVPARLFDHVATALDPDEPDPVKRMGWRQSNPAPLPKVAARLRPDLVIEEGNHGAHYETFQPAHFEPLLVVRHYSRRSVDQLVRKIRNGAAALKAAEEIPDHVGAHWRSWGALLEAHGEEAIDEMFHKWYWRPDPREPKMVDGERQAPLIYDPAPVT